MISEQTGSALVQASALQRVFKQGGRQIDALTDANCTISPGDRIAITGPSGSGKSTLLHLLAGLDVPSSGGLSWPAHQARGSLRPSYLSIALQMPDLLPALTVAENVALPLLLMQMPPDESQSAASNLLKELDLANLADQLPEELSGGQAQRVSLARSLVACPRLVLADEPTGQLDHPTAHRLFDLIFEVLDNSDTAFVIATHDRAVADRMSTQWKIERGVLKA
jgi:ABC-type lipoprotein export system ATPase subunit